MKTTLLTTCSEKLINTLRTACAQDINKAIRDSHANASLQIWHKFGASSTPRERRWLTSQIANNVLSPLGTLVAIAALCGVEGLTYSRTVYRIAVVLEEMGADAKKFALEAGLSERADAEPEQPRILCHDEQLLGRPRGQLDGAGRIPN